MITITFSLLAGILLVQLLPALPDGAWLLAIMMMAGLVAVKRCYRLAFVLFGIAWALYFASLQLSDRLSDNLEGQELVVKGTVVSLPEQEDKRLRFDFHVTDSTVVLPKKIRLSWYNNEQTVKAGQQWSFTVKLKKPHGTLNPAGFDYERWLFLEGIGATGYIRPAPPPLQIADASPWRLLSWRQAIADQLSDIIKAPDYLALIKALTIGDGSQISHQQWDVFRKTGTTHLVVISGSHIALIAGLAYLIMLKLWARTGMSTWSPQKVAAITAIVVAIFYAGLAGFTVPTQRAVLMLSTAMLAIILQRHTQPLQVLMLAMFGVLLYDPLAVLSAGFWLSFAAVAVILYISTGRVGKSGVFLAAFKVNWVTSVALAPLLLVFFQQVSLIAPLANMIVVPVISFIVVPLALLAVVVMLFSTVLAAKLFYLVVLSLKAIWWLLVWLATLPMASLEHPAPPLWSLVFVLPGLMLLMAPRGVPVRWLGLVLLFPAIFVNITKPPTGSYKLTLLDVGQGLSTVVQTTNHWLVFDTGGKFSSESDSGQSIILPFLRSQGLSHIDSLIISHGDNDHIGGAESVLNNIQVQQLLTSVPQQLAAYTPINCTAGQTWQWDGVVFTILSPALAFDSDNNNSCVLKIAAHNGTTLLTGDIEADAETWLVQHYGDYLKADVLVAPHHGSKTSSTIEFLQAVKPAYLLIPSGYRNQFGHPHPLVLERYRQINAQYLMSAESGAIEVNMIPTLAVKAFRATAGRYWNNSQ